MGSLVTIISFPLALLLVPFRLITMLVIWLFGL